MYDGQVTLYVRIVQNRNLVPLEFNIKAKFIGNSQEVDFDIEVGTEGMSENLHVLILLAYHVLISECITIFNGEFHIFCGFSKPKQISLIENCSLKRKGTLLFDFKLGSCATMLTAESAFTEESVYLCFGSDFKDTCQEYPRSNGSSLGSHTKCYEWPCSNRSKDPKIKLRSITTIKSQTLSNKSR